MITPTNLLDVDAIPIDEIPAAIEALGALVTALAKRQRESAAQDNLVDEMLDVHEASARLGVSPSWLYHRRDLSFRTKIGGKVRYSSVGISKYLRLRAGR